MAERQTYSGYYEQPGDGYDEELACVGRGTSCGEYMRRFWHPVAMTAQVGDVPLPVRRLGENLVLYSYGDYGENWKLIDADGVDIEPPDVEFEESPGHFTEWHQAITGEREQARSNFPNYSGKLTETILLGNLAVWDAAGGEGRKIEWDADEGGEDIISVVRFLETDTLDEGAFDTLITALPALSSRNWESNKPDLDQSQFVTLNISSLKFYVDETVSPDVFDVERVVVIVDFIRN